MSRFHSHAVSHRAGVFAGNTAVENDQSCAGREADAACNVPRPTPHVARLEAPGENGAALDAGDHALDAGRAMGDTAHDALDANDATPGADRDVAVSRTMHDGAFAVEALAPLFRLLGDASRLSIVFVCLHEAVCVSDIARATGLSPSLVSHHLRLLRGARVVRGVRRGKQIFYTAADDHVRRMIDDMREHVVECRQDE
ncbi:MAG: ArsR/SmtB family transcription factor [Janthinobacterium lividum]